MKSSRGPQAGGVLLALLLGSITVDADTTGGWNVEASVTLDLLAGVSGGRRRGIEIPGLADLAVTRDSTDRYGGEHALRMRAQATTGGAFSTRRSADLQVVSNIDAPNTGNLLEAWYRYRPTPSLMLKAGLNDVNFDFYVLEPAATLLHSSFGIGPELSQANAAIYPLSALSLVCAFESTDGYVSARLYDGVPGDPGDPYGLNVRLADGDGVLAIVEAGRRPRALQGKVRFGLGAWYSTARFADFAGRDRRGNGGAYVIASAPVGVTPTGGDVVIFGQAGVAEGHVNPVTTYVGAGISWSGPLATRPSDVLSIGIARARLGDRYRATADTAGRAETVVEMTYAAAVDSWLVLQPDIQVVIDPAAGAGISDAVVLGMRLIVALPWDGGGAAAD